MRHLMVPTAVSGIHFVAAVACMCSNAAVTIFAAAVLVLPDIHCSLAVGAATSDVVGVVAIVDASVAGAIDVGFSTLIYLIASAPSTPLVCPVQT